MMAKSWDEYMTGLLLGGRWLPVTGRILFINAPVEHCADELVLGARGRFLEQEYGHPLTRRNVTADSLDGLLSTLLPLEAPVDRRTLLLQTARPEWTAVFTSHWRGQDHVSPMKWFSASGISSVAIIDIPHTPTRVGGPTFYGHRAIQMYEILPSGERRGHSLGVRAANNRTWDWVHYPESPPFPSGSVCDPDARRVTDRFTHEHLLEMAALYGLRPADEDFYAPDGTGIIVERTDPMQPGQRTYSLAQARGEEPDDR
jgi:hypothetical protein